MVTNDFMFLPLADLQQLYAQYKACLLAIATVGQSYSVAGKSFTKADMAAVSETLGSIGYAIAVKTGQSNRFGAADMSHGPV